MDDPIPEVVRQARQIPHDHTTTDISQHDQGREAFRQEALERAYWQGLREVIREEVEAVLRGWS